MIESWSSPSLRPAAKRVEPAAVKSMVMERVLQKSASKRASWSVFKHVINNSK